MNNNTRYITKEELQARQKEEAFRKDCEYKAAVACNMLREQLRDQEMSRHIENMYSPTPTQVEFVFVSRKEVKEELDKRVKKLTEL